MFESAALPHIEIDRTTIEGARRKVAGRGAGRQFSDREKHGDDIHENIDFIFDELGNPEPALGIDPRLILVVKIGTQTVGPSEEPEWHRSGLRIIEARESSRVVAFSDDPQMTEFVRRLDLYSQGPKKGQISASYEGFFDNIVSVRRYGRQDRLGVALASALETSNVAGSLTVDVEIWHPGEQQKADDWMSLIDQALRRLGADVHDSFSSAAAGVSIMRVTAVPAVISKLLNTDLVAKVETLPAGQAGHLSPSDVSLEQLSGLPLPAADAPIVGIIDSGIQAEHPLVRGCVAEIAAVNSFHNDGADRNGHGTAVASILLRGSIEEHLTSGEWADPPCRILSVRVLDGDNKIPFNRLPQSEITEAVSYLAARGVKVINLSLGDENTTVGGDRAPVLAAVLDSLAKKFGVVFVVPTGTMAPALYSGKIGPEFRENYPQRMLESPDAGLIDPAPSAIAITVGGAVPALRSADLGTHPIGKPGWPSPFSRIGPGINGAIKPEVSAPAGTLGLSIDKNTLQHSDAFRVAVADGRPDGSALVAYDVGTSLAAPRVARACAIVQEAYPEASANLIRSLVLQSVTERVSPLQDVKALTKGVRDANTLWLAGYGEVSEQRSVLSGDRDTVLFAEETIALDSVHLYTIPVPDAFFISRRARRGITVSLCYDPPVRARRMDYLGSHMQWELLRGVSPEATIDLLLAEEKSVRRARKDAGIRLDTLSDLSNQQKLALRPSRMARSAGANQVGRIEWSSALKRFNENASELVLAVQNINRWDSAVNRQPYAVAIRFWVSEELPPIYADLRAKVRAMKAQASVRAQARG
ncbi:S8 family peptidase [Streptomyces sp. NPDC085460]|uniref:S8 family peptidase n=1 Tax=Streptomyces TaxID=1883 RepID=UPI0037D5A401